MQIQLGTTPKGKLTIPRGFGKVNSLVHVCTAYVKDGRECGKIPALERFEDKVKRDFAKRLKEARIAAGYRFAAQFANALGEEVHTYRGWERGQYLPDIPKMARLCQLLDLEPNELVPLAVSKKGRRKSDSDNGRSAA